MTQPDPAREPAVIYINQTCPTLEPLYFQGIPGIGITPGGTLWATWYGGGKTECKDNYVLLTRQDPATHAWPAPWIIVRHRHPNIRTYDPTLWTDPQGRLWLFWAQCFSPDTGGNNDGRGGVWGAYCENPDAAPTKWSAPKWFCDGVMMNKPTLDEQGRWLMPVSLWKRPPFHPDIPYAKLGPYAAIYDPKADQVTMHNPAEMPFPVCDEHHVLPLKDGRWSLWARTISHNYLAAVSHSTDEGKTWTQGVFTTVPCPNTRFYIVKLQSGAWLLISHDLAKLIPKDNKNWPNRSHLTAWVSDDEGATWTGGLLLDERVKVSYPDVAQAADGRIHVIYDRDRYADRDILLASFREEDVRQGRVDAVVKQVVNTAPPVPK